MRLASFGAFVSLGGGVDGLLHVSRLGGGKRLKSAGEAVRPRSPKGRPTSS
ncbi:MAG: hypothetical protein ACM3L8_02670 [Verrucomicrobiota bacterium]